MKILLFSLLLVFNIFNNGFSQNHQNFNENGSIPLVEKVYLQIDRVVYSSGDDVWFKAYVIDQLTNKLSKNTNNLHVELITPDSKILLSNTIRMNEGLGNGDFHLSDSVPSGRYRIRAYTNYMRNYTDPLYFLKEIVVINPTNDSQDLTSNIQRVENRIDLDFFPEGGSLIDNVSSTVAFKALNALGLGCDVNGELFSSSGDLITTFKSIHLGMGYFTLKPVQGLSYYVIVKNMDATVTKTALPKSFPTGVNISSFVTVDKQLFVTVKTNKETLSSLRGSKFSLSFSLPGLITNQTNITITDTINNFLMPIDNFPDGIIRITLSEIEGLPLCERLVYFQKHNDVLLNIVTDKKEYNPREKVSVSLSLSGDSSFSGSGVLSFAAVQESFTDNSSQYPTTIASWFLLESDVHGPVEEPSYYFDPSNKNRLDDLDLLLLTQGWRDFKWKHDTAFSFIHENGYTLTGRVKRVFGNKPIQGSKINMIIYSNKTPQFSRTETDLNGSFSFERLDFTGMQDIFISATDKNERMEGRLFIDSLFYAPPELGELTKKAPEMVLPDEDYTELRQEAIVKLAVNKKYKLSDTIEIGGVIITAERTETPQEIQVKESRRFYATPDKELLITPAVENSGGDVFSLLSGRVAGLRVIRAVDPSDPNFPFDVKIIIRGQVSSDGTGAIILLDGQLVENDNMSYILSLPIEFIDRVDVLSASPAFGMSGANGIVNIITRSERRKVPTVTGVNTASFNVKGFDASRIFYCPKHNNPKDPAYMPDMRSTIFWEPNITIEKKGNAVLEYYNADPATTINLTVEGITEEGIPITGRARYEVK